MSGQGLGFIQAWPADHQSDLTQENVLGVKQSFYIGKKPEVTPALPIALPIALSIALPIALSIAWLYAITNRPAIA